MTLEAFLRWEESQEFRYEFDGFQPVAVTGGTDAHEAIGGRLRTLLYARVRSGCRVRGPSMKIEVLGRIRYPDAFVYCSGVGPKDAVAREPVVVFEVLSASTSRTDRIEKLAEYQATPSIQRYAILEQDSIGATVFSRLGPNWVARPLKSGDRSIMPEIGAEIDLDEIYQDVVFPPPDEVAVG